ncbi:MAG: hypothetical protein A4E29_01454 [Methanomassiliicoccales archaeon PtaB.Bin134]|nr:MAG: hypothetical protein A4E29_01454 [Methanomassiliicoccales archaeon PtaB.Bin134]
MSIARIGEISAAVPVMKTSSAMYSSERVMSFSTTSTPMSLARVMTQSLVMPSRIPADTGGVSSRPPFTMKTFSPVPSATVPLALSMSASSQPCWMASSLAMTEFT